MHGRQLQVLGTGGDSHDILHLTGLDDGDYRLTEIQNAGGLQHHCAHRIYRDGGP